MWIDQRARLIARMWRDAGGDVAKLDLCGMGFAADSGVEGHIVTREAPPDGSAPFILHQLGAFTEGPNEYDGSTDLQWWEIVLMNRRNAGTTEENLGKHVPHVHSKTPAYLRIVDGYGFMYFEQHWHPVRPGKVVEVPAGAPHGFYTCSDALTMVSVQRGGQRIQPPGCEDPHCYDFRVVPDFPWPSLRDRAAMDLVAERMRDRFATPQHGR